MLIGNVDFNPEFFKGMNKSDFEKFAKAHNYEADSGVTVDELAEKLGIKSKKEKVEKPSEQ